MPYQPPKPHWAPKRVVAPANYDLAFGEGEAWDVAITNAGHAIVTTEYNGSGRTFMRRLELTTDTYSGI